MVNKNASLHKAFTLIELIFAIVIIGIVFLSLPSLSTTNTNAVESSVNQEALFAASAELSKLMTFEWDDNSTIFILGIPSFERVVDTTNNAALARVGTTPYRIGHVQTTPASANHRQLHATVQNVSSGATNRDIFSRTVTNRALFTAAASGNTATGYKKNSLLTITANYCDDAVTSPHIFTSATTGVSNMKMIEVLVDIPDSTGATDGVNDIVLRSYAANIGEGDLFKW